MDKEHIKDTNIQVIKEWTPTNFIGNDIIITDKINLAPTTGQPHRMNFILLAICTKGEIGFTVDTQRYTAKTNDAIIISDRHIVEHYHTSDDAEGMLIVLSVGFFYETVNNVSDISTLFMFSRNNHVVSLSQKEADIFRSYCDMLKGKIADTENQFRRELSRTLVLAMFYDMGNVIYRVQKKSDKKQNRADAIFTKFILLVEDNYKTERRVGWYAEQLCITPKYLSETVKHVSRRTPNEWIDRYVTLEIRILLRNSTKSIKEIATDLCFPNQSFLGKYFKEHVGMSPSEYRKS